ncbi:MAG: sensor histidine kinase, partial [Deltaproteobacteria bacterium]|nr:sensor histidine kinase [Deltaproteobacteria bacterium]
RFVLKEPDREAAPVYGNKRWLELMLTHLLHELDNSISPFDQRIVLTTRQLGNHLILRAQNESIPHHERTRNKASIEWFEGLSLNLCRRIAELHGGTLRLDLNEIDGGASELTGFILSIPTSSPQVVESFNCSDCSLIKQIENYANDLAELIDHCHELEETRSTNNGQVVNR